MQDFNFEFLDLLKEQSVALKLLRSPHFPLIGSFFYQAFIRKNRRNVPYQELIALLDHYLADINERYQSDANNQGEDKYPKSARAYIDDWISAKGGYLRKYLPLNTDEPECDLLPDVEKALRWLEEMQGKSFVGTESRLKLLLQVIAELVHGTSEDQQSKLATLEQKKTELEQQIQAVKLGMDIGYSNTQVREKMYLIADMSRQLLGDFRQVEANFRELDKATRKKITLGGLQKGNVLEAVFNDQDIIDDSDEGKSFSAFFELLMHGDMRTSMRGDLKALLNLEHSKEFASNDELLQHLYSYLLEAGAKVNGTKVQITDQLRRYIQEQSQDNKRILELIREVEAKVHQIDLDSDNNSELLTEKNFVELDSFQAQISQLFSRNLYQVKQQESFELAIEDKQNNDDVDLSRLFEVSHINEFELQKQIDYCMQQNHGQATLAQVIEQYPIQYGLDEVLTYVKLACEQTVSAHINQECQQVVIWDTEQQGKQRQLSLPTITFVREL
ncbi:MAG: DUF3375 domain-containing protein [Colwellia sp.]|nr:DUF3375 domain-containing protein [Colwellia sp.]